MIGDLTFLYLQQEDGAATHGKSAACSGAAVNAGAGLDHALLRTGTPGVTPVTLTIAAGTTEAGWFFESPGAGFTRWDDGIYMVPIEIAAASSSDIELAEVHICRVNSAGVNQGTIAAATGLAMPISGPEILYVQLVAAGITAASATDRLYVVCVFENTGAGSETIDLVPSQEIRTPIVLDRLVRVVGHRPEGSRSLRLDDHNASGVTELVGLMPEVSITIAIELPIAELVTVDGDMTQMQVTIDGAPVPGTEIGT